VQHSTQVGRVILADAIMFCLALFNGKNFVGSAVLAQVYALLSAILVGSLPRGCTV